MARARKEGGTSGKGAAGLAELLGGLAAKAVDLFGIAGAVLGEAKGALRDRAEKAAWHAVLLLTLSAWMSLGLVLLLLGLLELLIQQVALPRGGVYAVAGAIVFLAATAGFFALRQRYGAGRR